MTDKEKGLYDAASLELKNGVTKTDKGYMAAIQMGPFETREEALTYSEPMARAVLLSIGHSIEMERMFDEATELSNMECVSNAKN